MTGREKSGLKTESATRHSLRNAPAILTDYYNYQTDMQPTSLQTYTKHLIRFSEFLGDGRIADPKSISPGVLSTESAMG